MAVSASDIHVSARLRSAGPGDINQIELLEKASFEWAPEDAFNRRQIVGLLHNPRALVRVAVSKMKVLGWCAGLIRQNRRYRSGRIYAVAVHPDAQGLRIGRRLLDRMLREMKHRGVIRIFLEVDETNKPAIALYMKLGFVENRRIHHYYGKGRHALHFRLSL